MGDTFRTRLKVAGNEDFIVKTRNSSNQVRLTPGENVEIGGRRVLSCFGCMRRNWFSVFILNIAFAVLVYLPVRLILFSYNG